VRKNPEIDLEMVKRKVNSFVDMIVRAEDTYEEKKYIDAHRVAKKLIKKIKNFRQGGLQDKGEYSYENLTFKYLRNRDHMKRLFDLRDKSYDKELSLEGKYDKKFKIFVNQEDYDQNSGFDRLREEEIYQRRARRRRKRAKKAFWPKNSYKVSSAYPKLVNITSGVSAPPAGE